MAAVTSCAYSLYFNQFNNNNNIDSYIVHFYLQCALHYESLLKVVTFLAYVTLYIK